LGAVIQTVVSSGVTIVVYAVILAGVYKLFQIATDVNEMKDLLRDIKRNTQEIPSPHPEGTHVSRSPEDVLRTLSAESYPAATVIEPH
jgi:hypothetical protein